MCTQQPLLKGLRILCWRELGWVTHFWLVQTWAECFLLHYSLFYNSMNYRCHFYIVFKGLFPLLFLKRNKFKTNANKTIFHDLRKWHKDTKGNVLWQLCCNFACQNKFIPIIPSYLTKLWLLLCNLDKKKNHNLWIINWCDDWILDCTLIPLHVILFLVAALDITAK